jgi:hypothetical protein
VTALVDAPSADRYDVVVAAVADLPGDTRDGRPVGRLIRTERQGPGSIVVDATGRRFADEVIAGLFAVGNVSAHPVCAGYPGAGGTLGPALTMAYLAGQSVGAGTAGRRAATSMARRQ